MTQKKRIRWRRLDNASKIFPATCNNRDTKVFRLACELYEKVDPLILQFSLDMAIKSFPIYRSVLRRGAFWYYFEQSDIRPIVEMESLPLCAPIYIKDQRNLLFRVSYYNKRINLEVFHALTDGAGVLWFMETIIYYYMTEKYRNKLSKEIPKINYKASISQMMDDSFEKNYSKDNSITRKSRVSLTKAYNIKGTRTDENRTKLIEGSMSAKAVLKLAHSYDTTLTIFLTALLIYSIYKDMPSKLIKYPIVLSVPINLRQYFDSKTARNFFSTMDVSYIFENEGNNLEDIIVSVKKQFDKGLTKEELYKHLDSLMSLEKNPLARIIPLPIKDYALKIANYFKSRSMTSSISNIGRIMMPPEFEPYIDGFSICISARRPQIVLCSYGDKLVISFTSPFEETDIQRTFFQYLSDNDIEIEILSNL